MSSEPTLVRSQQSSGRATGGSIFRALDFFMVRAAALPTQALETVIRSPQFSDALTLASPSLFSRFAAAEAAGNGAEQDVKLDRAVSRYARRMTTRPTPFGLFAGVGIGRFGGASALSLGALASWKRHVRPDMEWLLALIRSFETDPNLSAGVRLFSNALVLLEGSRLVLTNPTNWDLATAAGAKEKPYNVSVRATRPVQMALNLARNGMTIADLVRELAIALDETETARIEAMVRSLLAREFLVSELRPPPTTRDPLGYVGSVVARLSGPEQSWIGDLRRSIAEYQGAAPPESISLLQPIRDGMARHKGSARDLHVDLVLPDIPRTLPAEVRDEFARAADAVWRLSAGEARVRHLKAYHGKFLERYGVDREVPLMQLLHEELGLGPPSTYLEPPKARHAESPAPQPAAMSRLAEICHAAIAKGEREVQLSDAILGELPTGDNALAPASFELYAEVLARSASALEQGDFQLVLSPLVGADETGKTFGRFLYALPDVITDELRRVHQPEVAAEPDAIHADLAHLPGAGKLANMVLVPSLRQHELSVGTTPSRSSGSIRLDDLMVGATPDRLFLRDKTSGREVIASTSHMLNYELLPNAIRLCLELPLMRGRPFGLLDTGPIEYPAFFPRIVYHRTVLAPMTWNLRRSDLKRDGSPWPAALHRWRERWSVPRFVFMGFADQKLLLDLDDESQLAEIEGRLKIHDVVTLIEMIGSFEDRIFSSDGGKHFTECVVPLVRRVAVPKTPLPAPRFGTCEQPDVRIRLPGSEWLFIKLYCNEDRLARLLVEQVVPFAEACVGSLAAEQWFYLFYRDPESHLRLRFHCSDVGARARLLDEVGRWASALTWSGQIRDMVIAPYEREIERYGGPDLIEHGERYFCEDSQFCALMVQAELAGEAGLDRVQLMAIGAADMAMRVAAPAESHRYFSGKFEDRTRFSERLREVCLSIWAGCDDMDRTMQVQWIKAPLERRGAAIKEYVGAIRSIVPAEHREAELSKIVSSLIHMQCNRMNGDEPAALALAKRIVTWMTAMHVSSSLSLFE